MEKFTANGRKNAGADASRIAAMSVVGTKGGARTTSVTAGPNRARIGVPTAAGGGAIRRVVSLVPFSQPPKDRG